MKTLSNEELIAAAMWCADANTTTCVGCPAFNHCDENDMFSLERELAKRLKETSDAIIPVRCKNCEHRHTRPNCAGRPMDFYCADGERRFHA